MLDKNNIPRHVAIVMDGNGRWARKKGFPRIAGHRQGMEQVKKIISAAVDLGIGFLTLFAFSAENWSRPQSEVKALMRFLSIFLSRESQGLMKKDISFRFIGREKPIPADLFDKLKKLEEKTKANKSLMLILAFNYGGRQEILDALKKFAFRAIRDAKELDRLNESNFAELLYTAGIPDPDLLIRTSGEARISNFLLWQLSYSELYFTQKLWPDFGRADLEEAIEEYQKRERRFGGINA